MTQADVAGVKALSDVVHPGLPEREAVFADRLSVCPAGCLVLADGIEILGYALTHPGRLFEPPALDRLIAPGIEGADSHYIHDVVVAPQCRGGGRAADGVRRVLAVADAHPATALVSVYGTQGFWSRFGFRDETASLPPSKLLPYGTGASYMVRRRP